MLYSYSSLISKQWTVGTATELGGSRSSRSGVAAPGICDVFVGEEMREGRGRGGAPPHSSSSSPAHLVRRCHSAQFRHRACSVGVAALSSPLSVTFSSPAPSPGWHGSLRWVHPRNRAPLRPFRRTSTTIVLLQSRSCSPVTGETKRRHCISPTSWSGSKPAYHCPGRGRRCVDLASSGRVVLSRYRRGMMRRGLCRSSR